MHVRSSLVRRLVGVALSLFGVLVLFGGLFVPLRVVLDEPSVVPAPESWIAIWLIGVGLLVAVWPARRHHGAD